MDAATTIDREVHTDRYAIVPHDRAYVEDVPTDSSLPYPIKPADFDNECHALTRAVTIIENAKCD